MKILQKLRCLVAFQNRPSAPIGRDENFVNFEFPKDNFVKRSLALSAKRKLRISLSIELCLPICVSQRCIFSLEMRNTGLSCKPTGMSCLTSVSLLRIFFQASRFRFDYVTRGALAARNNEAQGLGKHTRSSLSVTRFKMRQSYSK